MYIIEIKHDLGQSPIMNCIPTKLAELLLILPPKIEHKGEHVTYSAISDHETKDQNLFLPTLRIHLPLPMETPLTLLMTARKVEKLDAAWHVQGFLGY